MTHPLTDWDAQPLGELSDREIARRVGCHYETVRLQRRARGIPACPHKRSAKSPRRTMSWAEVERQVRAARARRAESGAS